MAETPPICVRMDRQLVKRVDAAARCHGWTRTTWILRAIGQALVDDETVYGPTPEQVTRSVERRADAVDRVRRWRKTQRESVPGAASPGTTP